MSLPRVIEEENDPEVLRAYMKYIINQNEEIKKENSILRAEKAQADQQRLKLDDDLLVFKKKVFGKSSEKRNVSDRCREKLKKQVSLQGSSLAPAPSPKEQKSLQEIEIKHELSAEDLANISEEYGFCRDSEWECLTGLYDESTEIDVVVQSYRRKKHKRCKYRLKETKGTDQEIIVTAPGAKKIVPGSNYSPEFACEVVADKYINHMPLERQRREMESKGLKVTCKTLYSLSFYVASHLECLAEKIKEEIKSSGLALHLDETPWPINNKKQDDGYMWVMSNQAGSYYQFEPTRSGKIATELAGSYQGPVLTDGYTGYISQFKNNENIDLCFCWAHMRRKFTDIAENYPKECKEILDLLEELFKVEHEAKDYDQLKALRKDKSTAVVKSIECWLIDQKPKARAESGLKKAINYAMNQWNGLIRFLNDVRVPLTNNEAERTIRHSVMGRKNFYGSRTINGADTTSTLYTIIESCKKVELDPRTFVHTMVNRAIDGEDLQTPLQYARQVRR